MRDNLETLYGAIEDGALDLRVPKHAKKELEAYERDPSTVARNVVDLDLQHDEYQGKVGLRVKG